MAASTKRPIALLTVKFLVLAPVCMVLWLLCLPTYVRGLGYAAGSILRYCLGYGITGISVAGGGLLNTATSLTYEFGANSMTLPAVGHLVANMAPFVALVLATPGLGIKRIIKITAIGAAAIAASQALTIIVLLAVRSPVELGRGPIPKAIGFMSIMLPFLLWIVLAYWQQLVSFLSEEDPATEAAPKDEEKKSA